MTKKMRKIWAIVALVAMIISITPVNAFAVGPNGAEYKWAFKTGSLKEKASNSTLVFNTKKDGVATYATIQIDFPADGTPGDEFSVVTGTTINTNGWTGTAVTNKQVVLTKATAVTAATIEIPVVNPNDADGAQPQVTLTGLTADIADPELGQPATLGTDPYYTVKVDPATAKDKATSNVTATVTHNGVGANVHYDLFNGETTPASISYGNVVNGSTTISNVKFEKTGATSPQYKYSFVVNDGTYVATGEINVLQDLQNLTGLDNVIYGDSRAVNGTLVNASGTPYAAAAVQLKDPAGNPVAASITGSNGAFSFNATFNQAGKWTLEVNNVVYKEVVVAPKTFTVNVTGTATGNFNSALKAEVKEGTKVVTDATLTLLKADGTLVATSFVTGASDYAFTTNLPVGTYTVKAVRNDNGADVAPADNEFVGTTNFNIVPASKLNVSVTGDTGIVAGSPNSDLAVTVADVDNNGVQAVKPADAALSKTISAATVEIAGSTLKNTVSIKDTETGDGKSFTFNGGKAITAEQAGTATLTVTAKYWDGSTQTYTKTITIGGYKVNMTLGSLVYGSDIKPSFTVTDDKGTPINNGSVVITGPALGLRYDDNNNGTFEGTELTGDTITLKGNINNGLYAANLTKLTNVGNLTITVKDSLGNPQAQFVKTIAGANTYTVTADKQKLVAGFPETVKVTVKDAANAGVTGLTNTNILVNGQSKTITDEGLGVYSIAGVNAADLSNVVTDVTIAVTSAGNTNSGSVKITGVNPVVNVTGDNKVTDGIQETKTFTVIDPRTNTAFASDAVVSFEIDAKNASATGTGFGSDLGGAKNLYTANINATDNAVVTDAPQLVVSVNSIKAATLDVVKATLTADVTKVFLGVSNRVALTLKDAHGVGIANKAVNTDLGTTSTDGTVTVTVTPVASGTYTFATDVASVKLTVVEPTADSKFIATDIVKNVDGFDVAVKNNGLGTDNNLKVVVKDNAGNQIGYTYISELKGGAIGTAFVKAATTKQVTVTTYVTKKVAYTKTVKVAYKVKVGKKYVTKYKYVKRTFYKYVKVAVNTTKTVNVTGTVQLLSGDKVLDTYNF